MSAVVLEDFVKAFYSKNLSPRMTSIILRSVVVIFGALCVLLVFIVERLGTVLQVSIVRVYIFVFSYLLECSNIIDLSFAEIGTPIFFTYLTDSLS